MKKSFLFCFLLAILFVGCGEFPKNNLVAEVSTKTNYKKMVDVIEKKFNKCFTEELLFVDIYIVKEEYKLPVHTKFNLYVMNNIPELYKKLGTITIFEENGKAKVYINQRKFMDIKSIKEWYEKGMNCEQKN